jgi:predicted small metal-binding protein
MSADSMVIECPCGVVLRGENEPGVVAAARQHARQTHDMDLSDDQAREMARPA